jgi:hypothetical protein
MFISTSRLQIRDRVEASLLKLAKWHPQACSCIVEIVLRTPLPLWVTSAEGSRARARRQQAQCEQYFALRSQLIALLEQGQFQALQPTAQQVHSHSSSIVECECVQMLDDETDWMLAYQCSSSSEHMARIDSRLIQGHLSLLSALLARLPMRKRAVGVRLIRALIEDFLFPASARIHAPPS